MNNPLTLVPSEGTSDEFPVLKAFQEYIDAEQTKARKRMLGLSVFFIVLLFVVIVTFVLILTTVLNRNQSLSDRLLDYALREKAPIVQQQVPTSVIPQTSADIVKKLIERLEKEQSEMKLALEKQRKDAEDRAAAAKQAHAEDLARVKAQFEKERAKVQKEADKKAQIERHRRRLYPDYYYGTDGNDDLPIPPPASTFRRSASLQGAEEISEKKQNHRDEAPSKQTMQKREKASPLSALKPVTYFNVDDDDSVPFLLETPQQNK